MPILAFLFMLVPPLLLAGPAPAAPLDIETVNDAGHGDYSTKGGPNPAVIRLQVMLDRAHASPGVIDGYAGENVSKAIAAWQRMHGVAVTGRLDGDTWRAVVDADPRPALTSYTIRKEDTGGPFVEAIPESYREQAKMEHLGYHNPAELLAERFHMDVELLRALNPGAAFKAGESITVAAVREGGGLGKVARIEADKGRSMVLVYGPDDSLIAAYPATIGSASTPSPEGTHTVKAIAFDPVYYYDPEVNFQQGDITEELELPPGPNNPVGTVWIDLSKETYGIHGAPEPASIGKDASHGCVRLTNWDAQELARALDEQDGGPEGVPVEFIEPPATPLAEQHGKAEPTAPAPEDLETGATSTAVGAKPGPCLEALETLGVAFEVLPPIDGDGPCGARWPLRVAELPGAISLEPPATLTCPMAEALARWAEETVEPAAREHLQADPDALHVAASYVCRTTNYRPGAKLSEHSYANAVDIMAVRFASREPLSVAERPAVKEHAGARAFQKQIRQAACAHFTTVLGPGTDDPHKDHFHFDLRQRSSGYRICQ